MPLAATTYMLLIRPTPDADDDIWDDELNTLLGLVDGHRHIVGEGRQIPSAGINIDAALSFNNQRITSLAGLAMQNLGADLAAGSYELYVTGGNLKFRNGAGTNVRITNGNQLDVLAAQGIAGDYGAVGAEVAFSDAADLYTFKQQVGAAVRQYAKMASADLSLFEYKAHPAAGVPANSVNMRSPAALAASYAWVFAGALPATQQIVQISAAGQLSYSNTIAQLLTASLGITVAVNQNVTLSGTGRYKHGEYTRTISAAGMLARTDVADALNWTLGQGYWETDTAGPTTDTIQVPLNFDLGEVITEVQCDLKHNGTVNGATLAMKLWKFDGQTETVTQIGATQTSTGVAATFETLTLTGLAETVTSPLAYYMTLTPAGVGANKSVRVYTARAKFTL